MKPGNLSEMKRCQIRRQTKDEDSIQHTSNASMCAFFILRIVGRGIPDAPDPLYEYRMCEVKKGI